MRSKQLLIGGAVLLGALAVTVWVGREPYSAARIEAGFVAKQTCSCLFVAGRSMDSCKTDYNAEDIRPLTFEVADDGVTVTALSGLLSARAEFAEGFGCHPAD